MKPSGTEYIVIGRILGTWGNQGQIRVDITTDFPERFSPSSTVYVNHSKAIIESVNWHQGKALLKLDIVSNTKEAGRLQGQYLEIHRSQVRSLPDGQFYHFELVGMTVLTTQQELVGKITDIMTTAGNDTYIINGPGGEILIPAAEDIVKDIDLKKRLVIIEPMKGLLDLNKKAAD